MNRLNDKIAIVTGGTQGLGKAIAQRFAESGVTGLVTCGRRASLGMEVALEITGQTGILAKFIKGDLGCVEDCRNIVKFAEQEFGRVDILVNAAAITDRGNLLDTSPELFDQMFAVNVRGPFFLMQETVKLMIRLGIKGAIVNIGSMSAHAGQPFIIAYCSSKGALATLTRNAAYSLLHNQIRVNQLNIGWMSSDGEDVIQRKYHGADDSWLEEASKKLPVGRLIDPKEVARAVSFMVSDDAGLMTGSVINFDQSIWGAYDSPQSSGKPLS